MKIFILERAYLEIPDISLSLFIPEPDEAGKVYSGSLKNGYAIYLEEYQRDYITETSKFIKEVDQLYKFNQLNVTSAITSLLKKHSLKYYTYMPKEYKYGSYGIPKEYCYFPKDDYGQTVFKVKGNLVRPNPFPNQKITNMPINKLQIYSRRFINKVEGYYLERTAATQRHPPTHDIEKTSNYIREFIVLNII